MSGTKHQQIESAMCSYKPFQWSSFDLWFTHPLDRLKFKWRYSAYLEIVSDGKRIKFLSFILGSNSVAVKHMRLKARKHNNRNRLNLIFDSLPTRHEACRWNHSRNKKASNYRDNNSARNFFDLTNTFRHMASAQSKRTLPHATRGNAK